MGFAHRRWISGAFRGPATETSPPYTSNDALVQLKELTATLAVKALDARMQICWTARIVSAHLFMPRVQTHLCIIRSELSQYARIYNTHLDSALFAAVHSDSWRSVF